MHYITLSRIKIENANCIAGITFGFPAVTQFLGFVHALSRKLQRSHEITLDGCAVVSHWHQIHAYRVENIVNGRKTFGDYYFKQSKNPASFPYQEKNIGKDTPIIEEGKMHLEVSLVIECAGFNGGQADVNRLTKHVKKLCYVHKLAGGTVTRVNDVLFDALTRDSDFRRIRRRLMPGFMLMDRSEYLAEHFRNLQQQDSDARMLDAWLNFSTLKYQAIPKLEEDETPSLETNANWERVSKPREGWLVPIMAGYRAISELYDAGEVAKTRDPSIPFCFTEAVYSIGEWISPHRINDLQQTFWRYIPPEDGVVFM